MNSLPKDYYSRRTSRVVEFLKQESLGALLVSSRYNLAYLSGFQGDDSWGFVSKKENFLITDSRYAEQARKKSNGFTVILRDGRSFSDVVIELACKLKWRAIGFEAATCSYSFIQNLRRTAKGFRVKPTTGVVEKLREIKDRYEIDRIHAATKIAVKGFRYIKQVVKPGLTEREVEAHLEYFMKKCGARRPAFDTIIASGPSSSMPHYATGEATIRKNGPVLVDMGVERDGYCSDLTRNVFLGRIPPLYKRILDIVTKAQAAGIQKVRPGVLAKAVDQACRGVIQESGYGRHFGHGTGHGIGLEVHEAPRIAATSQARLEPGMVVTIEPGIYLPGRFGVRVEDMVLVTEKGSEIMTRGLDG